MRETDDRLNQARNGLRLFTAILAAGAVLLAVAGIGLQSDSLELTDSFIRWTKISTPSLFPTGHDQRDTGYRHPAVDLRHGPQLPQIAPTAHIIVNRFPALFRNKKP